jgi:HK97 family phage major capsid protein
MSAIKKELEQAIRQGLEPVLDQMSVPRLYNLDGVLSAMTRAGIVRREHDGVNDDEKGISFAGVVRSLAAGGGSLEQARAFAGKAYGASSTITKALGASQFDEGGILVPEDVSQDVIELLRPLSAVRRGNPRIISMPRGSQTFPKIDVSASAAYVNENEDIPASQQIFGGKRMTARKLAAIVPISNELLTTTMQGADGIIRSDLIAELSKTEDAALLRGDGTESTPQGIRFQAAAGNISGTNGTSATQIEQDIVDLIDDLSNANISLDRAVFIMPTRSRNRLYNLRDSNGNLIFPEVREAGTLFGLPLIVSNTIPTDLGGGSATELYLVDFSNVVLGEIQGIRIETSRDGAYKLDGQLVSAFSRDQTLVRVVLFHDIMLRHPEAVAVKTGVAW